MTARATQLCMFACQHTPPGVLLRVVLLVERRLDLVHADRAGHEHREEHAEGEEDP